MCYIQVTVTMSKSSEFKVRRPNAVTPESVEMQKTVKVLHWFLVCRLKQIYFIVIECLLRHMTASSVRRLVE